MAKETEFLPLRPLDPYRLNTHPPFFRNLSCHLLENRISCHEKEDIMAKGKPSKRRNEKSNKTANNKGQLFLARTNFTTGEFTGSFYPPEAIDDMHAYLQAHSLIPFDYEYGSPTSRTMVENAVEILGAVSASSKEVLTSLAILGHSPCTDAYVALSDYVDSDKLHAGVACFALDECLGMSEALCA